MRRRIPVPLKLNEMVRSVSNELLVNAYAEIVDSSKGTVCVRSHPGLALFGNISPTSYRGSIELNEVLYAVGSTTLYSVSAAGVAHDFGTVDGEGYVIMAGDEDQVLVTNALGDTFLWNGIGFTKITADAYQSASSVASLNKTTLWSVQGSQEFFWSAIDDATTISGLDIASAEFKSDPLVRIFIYSTDILLFGSRSLEGWFDTGSTDAPYQRRGDLLLNVGLAGKTAVTEDSDILCWLAHDGTIRMLDSGAAVRISTPAVERLINGDPSRGTAGWADLSVTRAFTYVWRGHLFITFWNPDGCIQYDLTTKLWSQRQSGSSATWRIVDAVFAYGQYILWDAVGNGYTLDETTRYENKAVVDCVMVCPAITLSGQYFNLHKVDFMIDTGRAALGADPKMRIYGSDDGYTFPDYDEVSLGRTGDYDAPCDLNQQGQTREKTYKLVVSDDVPVTLTAIYADMSLCRG